MIKTIMLHNRQKLWVSPENPKRGKSISGVGIISLCLLCVSCIDTIDLDGYTLAGKGALVGFGHRCCEAERSDGAYLQAYALFEGTSLPHQTLALGTVGLGWVYGIGSNVKGLSFRPEKIHLEGLPHWAGDRISLSLKMYNPRTGETVSGMGEGEVTYSDTNGAAETYHPDDDLDLIFFYRMPETGKLAWDRFSEEPHELGQYRHHRTISIPETSIARPSESHVLFLVATNLDRCSGPNPNTCDSFEMEGPSLPPPSELWDTTTRPQFRVLDLWDTLNPLQEGSLFDAIGDGYRYDICVDLREQVRDIFDGHLEGSPRPL